MRAPRLLALPLLTLPLVACDPPVTTVVTIHANAETALLAVLDDSGDDWRVLPAPAAGELTLEVTGSYVLTGVCESDATRPAVRTVVAGPGDLGDWWMGCSAAMPVDVPVTSVDGIPLRLWIGPAGALIDAANPTMLAPAGTWDLVAIEELQSLEGEPRLVILHDVVVDDDLEVTIDFARDGARVERRTVEVSGVDDVTNLDVVGSLVTAGGTRVTLPVAWALVEGFEAFVIPPDALADGDRQVVSATEDVVERVAFRSTSVTPGATGAIAIALPAPLVGGEPVLGERPSASWSTAGTWDRNELHLDQDLPDGAWTTWDLRTYPGGDSGGGELRWPDVHAIDGWDPAWTIDPTATWRWSLMLSHDAGTTSQTLRSTGAVQL